MTDYVGLSHFQHYFQDFKEHYVVVGGFATVMLLDRELEGHGKATHDIDLVLLTTSSNEMSRRIKDYVTDGGYIIQKGSKDQYNYYRFLDPDKEGFAREIELFASNENDLPLDHQQRIIPIDPEEGLYSLSAIMLDAEYFQIFKANIISTDGVPHTNSVATILLKMSAFYDLKERGDKKWKKHRRDIFKLILTLTGDEHIELTKKMMEDYHYFIEHIKTLDHKAIKDSVDKMAGINKENILASLETVFT